MKKAFSILSIIVVLIIATLFIIPIFFKGDILQIIQQQVSKNLKAELKIGDIKLSMFKSFPNLNVSMHDLLIVGEEEFAQDTLIHIPLFEASVNLQSLISGEEIIVNHILMQDSRFLPIVNTEGKTNWDILKNIESHESETISENKENTTSEKGIALRDIAIKNLYIGYNDYQNSTYASVGNIHLQLSGNFSATNTILQLLLTLENISYRQQNNVWVNKTNLTWDTEIAANLQEKKFEIQKNDLTLNDLKLNLTGSLSLLDEKYLMDLKLNAPDTQFENLLSLVPQTLQHHIEGLKTSGEFQFDIIAKGEYTENQLPAIQAKLQINNASIQYPELPESIQEINLDLNITNPGGAIDSTRIDLNKFHFNIAGNPFHLFLHIVNPNDPLLAGEAKGTIDFTNLKKALPLKEITLEGKMTTDISFQGKYQYIEQEQYEKFIAKGNIQFNNILFIDKNFPEGISIPKGNIQVSPAQLHLNGLQAKIFSSDFLLQGKLSNYLPYLLRDETLKGDFSLTSNQINLNEFIIAQMRATKADTLIKNDTITNPINSTTPNAAEGALEIPKNMDIRFSTNIKTVIFDHLTIKNIRGNISLAQAVANLKNLSMELLNGSMVINGNYNTTQPKTPKVDFNLNISNFDINAAYHAFSFIKKSIPLAIHCEGLISASMNFAATLDQEMSPIMTTANGKGFLESKGILIKDNPAMNQLANILKNDELSRLSISQLKINFKLEEGNIVIEPFKTSFAGNPVSIHGKQSVAGNLDYTLSMTVNRNFFGKEINNLLKSIPGSNNIKTLDLDAKVGGTISKPVIKPDLSKAIKTVTQEVQKELKGNLFENLQKLFK